MTQESTTERTIISRIRKLLALSASSNPNEAASALAKANKLLLEHNLSMAQIEAATGKKAEGYIGNEIVTGRRIWQKALLHTIARHNLCYLFSVTGTPYCQLIGQPSNIEVVLYLHKHIQTQLETMATTAYRLTNTKLPPATWKDAFYMGAIQTISVRLEAERYAQDNQTKALVVRNEDELKDAFKRLFPQMQLRAGGRKTIRSEEGYTQGKEAGHRVTFHKEIR